MHRIYTPAPFAGLTHLDGAIWWVLMVTLHEATSLLIKPTVLQTAVGGNTHILFGVRSGIRTHDTRVLQAPPFDRSGTLTLPFVLLTALSAMLMRDSLELPQLYT